MRQKCKGGVDSLRRDGWGSTLGYALMDRAPTLAFALAASVGAWGAGCAPVGGPLPTLEAEVHRLRDEQTHQAQQIELLQSRLVLTEDTARQARDALRANARRQTITLGNEAPPPEPVRTEPVESTETASGDAPADDHDDSRPRLRIHGMGPIPQGPPIVVHPSERLPVVPIPPPPSEANREPQALNAPSEARTEPSRALTTPSAPLGTLDPSAGTAYGAALTLARAGRCMGHGGALEAFADFLTRWPDHPHADNAMYWRGECLARSGEAQQAIAEWEALLVRFPTGNKVADALYALAMTYRRQGDAAAADRAGQRLMDEYPDSDPARRMRAERHRP